MGRVSPSRVRMRSVSGRSGARADRGRAPGGRRAPGRCRRRRSRGGRGRRGRRARRARPVVRPSMSRAPPGAAGSRLTSDAPRASRTVAVGGLERASGSPLRVMSVNPPPVRSSSRPSRPSRSIRPCTASCPASGSPSRCSAPPVPSGGGGEHGGRAGGAQRRVALGRLLGVALAQHLPELDRERDEPLGLRLALGRDACRAARPRRRRAGRGRASRRGSPRRAGPRTGPGRGTAESGGRRRR